MRISVRMDEAAFKRTIREMLDITKVTPRVVKAELEKLERVIKSWADLYVPEQTGTLKRSYFGRVVFDPSRQECRLVVGYGGPNDNINPRTNKRASSYAWIVHEDLAANHPKGTAKYLERAITRAQMEWSPKETIYRGIRRYRK